MLRHRAPAVAKITLATALLPVLFFAVSGAIVHAQETPAAPASGRAARQETLKQITDRLSQSTGVRVMADTGLSRLMLSAPPEAVTAASLDDYLTRLTRRLPPGTVALKLYLPPSSETRRFTPDAVAQLARAQMELLGRPAPNTVQIQGKALTLAEAAPVIRTLGLEPVYVLTNRQAPAVPTGPGGLNTTAIRETLAKQLGVANVNDIPTGTYKVTVPGPDGSPQEATVEVEKSEGKSRIMIRMGTPALP
jgi:hypothetical protein